MTGSAPIVPEPVRAHPEHPPALRRRHVHLWHADLDSVAADESILDDADRERAALMIPRVRTRFAASRCLLRRILGAYTGTDPASLRFGTVGEGKPQLAPLATDSPFFNLSHAEDRWLLAVSTLDVGVDVERTDRRVDVERVSRRLFTPAETDAILRESGDVRRRAFFRAWTGREALAKMRAEGMFTLSLPAEIRVDPAVTLALTGDAPGRWTLLEVPVPLPWCAALAVAGRPEGVAAFRVE